MIYKLIYVSTPKPDIKIDDVELIVDEAKIRNSTNLVTGFLCANTKCFIQCIEGAESVVKDLYERIRKDSRHSAIKVIYEEVEESRSFDNWSMGVILRMEKHKNILDRYCTGNTFDQYNLKGEDALKMLQEFSILKAS